MNRGRNEPKTKDELFHSLRHVHQPTTEKSDFSTDSLKRPRGGHLHFAIYSEKRKRKKERKKEKWRLRPVIRPVESCFSILPRRRKRRAVRDGVVNKTKWLPNERLFYLVVVVVDFDDGVQSAGRDLDLTALEMCSRPFQAIFLHFSSTTDSISDAGFRYGWPL